MAGNKGTNADARDAVYSQARVENMGEGAENDLDVYHGPALTA